MDLNKADENLKKMPIIESKIKMSKDGRFVVHKTLITDIKPMGYYQKVFENKEIDVEEEA